MVVCETYVGEMDGQSFGLSDWSVGGGDQSLFPRRLAVGHLALNQ